MSVPRHTVVWLAASASCVQSPPAASRRLSTHLHAKHTQNKYAHNDTQTQTHGANYAVSLFCAVAAVHDIRMHTTDAPESFRPRSPTFVSYPSGQRITTSWMRAACAAANTFCAQQTKQHSFVSRVSFDIL